MPSVPKRIIYSEVHGKADGVVLCIHPSSDLRLRWFVAFGAFSVRVVKVVIRPLGRIGHALFMTRSTIGSRMTRRYVRSSASTSRKDAQQ